MTLAPKKGPLPEDHCTAHIQGPWWNQRTHPPPLVPGEEKASSLHKPTPLGWGPEG